MVFGFAFGMMRCEPWFSLPWMCQGTHFGQRPFMALRQRDMNVSRAFHQFRPLIRRMAPEPQVQRSGSHVQGFHVEHIYPWRQPRPEDGRQRDNGTDRRHPAE